MKRTFTETVQVREYAVKKNNTGREWIPNIETTYEFCSVDEFLRTFKPVKLTEGLKEAIEKAYINCGCVSFNCGNGNKSFNFKKQ